MVTIWTLLSVASAWNRAVHQMDIYDALLHGDLEEEVYMWPPSGFRSTHPRQKCLLKKSLYSLARRPGVGSLNSLQRFVTLVSPILCRLLFVYISYRRHFLMCLYLCR